MLIETTTGKENFPGMMTMFSVIVMPSRRFTGKETYLNLAARANESPVRQQGGVSFMSAGIGLKHELVGSWITGNYDVPEGMVLKIFASQSQRGLKRDVAVLVQMRAQAALMRITAQLSGYHAATRTTASIEGRFDVLSPADAVQEGVAITPSLHKMLIAARSSTGFLTPTIVSAETAGRVVTQRVQVTNTAGEAVTVQAPRRRRMINLD